jgi:hypothetical protein
MKILYTSSDLGFLNLLKSQLETSGISVFIKNEYPPAAGEIPRIIAEPELWILGDEHFFEASTILRELLNKSSHSGEIWKCPQCGESLEGQFDLCWKCGHSRE